VGEVGDALRQRHRAEERKAPRIGLGLRELEQPDARRLQQHLHHRRLGRRGERHRVELAVEQRHDRRGELEVRGIQAVALEPVRLEQLAHQPGRAAAARAEVDAPAGKLRNARERAARQRTRRALAVKDP
jgi:hypothetical protein